MFPFIERLAHRLELRYLRGVPNNHLLHESLVARHLDLCYLPFEASLLDQCLCNLLTTLLSLSTLDLTGSLTLEIGRNGGLGLTQEPPVVVG
jgi:hypothetical protein